MPNDACRSAADTRQPRCQKLVVLVQQSDQIYDCLNGLIRGCLLLELHNNGAVQLALYHVTELRNALPIIVIRLQVAYFHPLLCRLLCDRVELYDLNHVAHVLQLTLHLDAVLPHVLYFGNGCRASALN